MKIYIVALKALMNGQPFGFETPMAYVFTQPTFNSVEECKSYAVANSNTLLLKLYEEFGQEYFQTFQYQRNQPKLEWVRERDHQSFGHVE